MHLFSKHRLQAQIFNKFLSVSSFEILTFLAPDGITDFGIALAQARNQLWTPVGAKSFLRGAQFFLTVSNSFKLRPTYFSRGAKFFPCPPPGYGPAVAKHCNLAFCSFVLKIDWSKTFLTEHAITCCVNGLTIFICLWCNARIVATGRKMRFHHELPFMTKQRLQFGCGYL